MKAADAKMRAHFSLSLWLRARFLPMRIGNRPLDEVLALAVHNGPETFRGLTADYICRSVLRTTRSPLLMRNRRCLREGLLGFYYLRAAGFEPELRFAIDPASLNHAKIKAHCWVCLDDKPVLNDKGKDMLDLFVFPHASGPTGA